MANKVPELIMLMLSSIITFAAKKKVMLHAISRYILLNKRKTILLIK